MTFVLHQLANSYQIKAVLAPNHLKFVNEVLEYDEIDVGMYSF